MQRGYSAELCLMRSRASPSPGLKLQASNFNSNLIQASQNPNKTIKHYLRTDMPAQTTATGMTISHLTINRLSSVKAPLKIPLNILSIYLSIIIIIIIQTKLYRVRQSRTEYTQTFYTHSAQLLNLDTPQTSTTDIPPITSTTQTILILSTLHKPRTSRQRYTRIHSSNPSQPSAFFKLTVAIPPDQQS